MTTGAMKFFSCQPDSHNGFASLINRTLSYFLVECPRLQAPPPQQRQPQQSPTSPQDQRTPAPAPQAGLASSGRCDAFSGVVGPTDGGSTVIKVQQAVTLPESFGGSSCCFSLANSSMYGTDLAVIGTSSGLLTILVMRSKALVFMPGRTPAAVQQAREALSGLQGSVAVPGSGQRFSTQGGPFALRSPGVRPVLSPTLSSHNGSVLGMDGMSEVDRLHAFPPLHLASQQQHHQQQYASYTAAVDPCVTVTWMRDKPVLFVGHQSGKAEWYYVSIPATQSNPASGNATARPNSNNGADSGTGEGMTTIGANGRTKVAVVGSTNPSSCSITTVWEGEGGGITVTLVCRTFHHCGSFLCSDSFPCNGYLVAGAQLQTFVFDPDHPRTPLYVLKSGCSYVACHPFLPFVACMSYGVSAPREDANRNVLRVLEWRDDDGEPDGAGCALLEIYEDPLGQLLRSDAYFSCSWKFSFDLQIVTCNMAEGALIVLSLAPTEGGRDTAETTNARYVASYRRLPLPLHSLVNVEYVSAATSALADEEDNTSDDDDSSNSSTAASAHERGNDAGPSGGASTRKRRKARAPKENLLAAQMLEPMASSHGGASRTATAARDGGGKPCHPDDDGAGGEGSSSWDQQGDGTSSSGHRMMSYSRRHRNRRTGVAQKQQLHGNQHRHRKRGSASQAHSPFASVTHVKRGAGAFSNVVGMNHAGEVTAVPVEASATASWLHDGHLVIGLSATLCTGSVAHMDFDDVEWHMKHRLRRGFCIYAELNVRALHDCPHDRDLWLLCRYITTLEHVRIVGSVGDVPGIISLLTMHSKSISRDPFPTVDHLVSCGLLGRSAGLASSGLMSDARRVLLLYTLRWLPSESVVASGSDGASDSCSADRLDGYLPPPNATYDQARALVERATAIDIFHGRYTTAAQILTANASLHSSYPAMANILLNHIAVYDEVEINGEAESAAVGAASLAAHQLYDVLEGFLQSLSPILMAAFSHVLSPQSFDYNGCDQLNIWDRIAIAIIRQRDNQKLVHVLASDMMPNATPMQRLLLLGVGNSTLPLMQQMVDSTNDFQLGACLFARVAAVETQCVAPSLPVSPSGGWLPPSIMLPGLGRESLYAADQGAAQGMQHWERWASAYRMFLDAEQEFVKRTMFDVDWKRLREKAQLEQCSTSSIRAPLTGSPNVSGSSYSTSPVAAGASIGGASSIHSISGASRSAPPLKVTDVPSSGIAGSSAPFSADATHTCVCGQPHNGATHFPRPVLSALRMLQPVCSVCGERVDLQHPGSDECYAWCTSCLHGGHVNHLRQWFRVHRRCPCDGCHCNCDQDMLM